MRPEVQIPRRRVRESRSVQTSPVMFMLNSPGTSTGSFPPRGSPAPSGFSSSSSENLLRVPPPTPDSPILEANSPIIPRSLISQFQTISQFSQATESPPPNPDFVFAPSPSTPDPTAWRSLYAEFRAAPTPTIDAAVASASNDHQRPAAIQLAQSAYVSIPGTPLPATSDTQRDLVRNILAEEGEQQQPAVAVFSNRPIRQIEITGRSVPIGDLQLRLMNSFIFVDGVASITRFHRISRNQRNVFGLVLTMHPHRLNQTESVLRTLNATGYTGHDNEVVFLDDEFWLKRRLYGDHLLPE